MVFIVFLQLLFPDDNLGIDRVVDQLVTLQIPPDVIPVFFVADPFLFDSRNEVFLGPLVIPFHPLNSIVDFLFIDLNAPFLNLPLCDPLVYEKLQYLLAHFQKLLFILKPHFVR